MFSTPKVEAELQRREELEAKLRAQFRGQQSQAFHDRSILALRSRMKKICQTLDERKGVARHSLWPPEPPPPLPSLSTPGVAWSGYPRELAAPVTPSRAEALEDMAVRRSLKSKQCVSSLPASHACCSVQVVLQYLHKEHGYWDVDDEYNDLVLAPQASQPDCKRKKETVYDY